MALVEKKKTKKAPKMRSLVDEKVVKSKIDETYDGRPDINFTEKELPEIKDWKVGEKYTVELEIEQTGMNIIGYGKDKGKMSATFKISKVGVEDKD